MSESDDMEFERVLLAAERAIGACLVGPLGERAGFVLRSQPAANRLSAELRAVLQRCWATYGEPT